MATILAHLLNFTLSFFFWLIVGRAVLGILVGGRTNFVTELFRRGTEPIFRAVRRVTPAFVPDGSIPILSLVIIVVLRLALVPWLLGGA